MDKRHIVLVLCLYIPTILCLSEEMQQLVNQLHATCTAETGVTNDLIAKVNAEKILFDDDNLKCYMKCLMAQTGCLDDDGLIDLEATIAVLPEDMRDRAEPVIRECGVKVGANPCETVWLTHKCYLEKRPDARLSSHIDGLGPAAGQGYEFHVAIGLYTQFELLKIMH